MRLEGKVAVITGASSGVGRSAALMFAKEGCDVVAVARRKEKLDELVAESAGLPGKVVAYVGDIANEETANGMVDCAINTFGHLDILINNAGKMDNFAPVDEMNPDTAYECFQVDVMGPALGSKRAIQEWLKTGSKGSIVNVASIAAICGGKSGVAYTMAKHAVIGLTKNTAINYLKQGIRCNCICPGGINTAMNSPEMFVTASQKGMETIMKAMAFETRSVEPEEIASICMFLSSDEASAISGAIVTADSGLTSF